MEPAGPPRTAHIRAWGLKLTVSLALLAVLAFLLDPRTVLERLTGLRPGWIAAALALSVLQFLVSAWRWRFTAARLGVQLPMRTAISEYYLATFLNQVLPGGVLGDASRAWRHARAGDGSDGSALRSVHAVALERLSGQAVMTVVAAGSAATLLGGPGAIALIVVALIGVLVARSVHRFSHRPAAGHFLSNARVALFAPDAFPTQLATSLFVVATYLIIFLMAARAVNLDTPTGVLLPLVAPVLVTMLLPVSIGGWGVREGAAAALWATVGLASRDGVAVSVAYGLIVLVSSLPGAAIVLLTLWGDRRRGRRGGRSPAGSAARGAEAPGPASRSRAG